MTENLAEFRILLIGLSPGELREREREKGKKDTKKRQTVRRRKNQIGKDIEKVDKKQREKPKESKKKRKIRV